VNLKLALFLFLIFTFALAYWTFVNWLVWLMADFDCVEGYLTCRRHLYAPLALSVGLPWLVWGLGAAFFVRAWKRL
jgi:hypothetical protein